MEPITRPSVCAEGNKTFVRLTLTNLCWEAVRVFLPACSLHMPQVCRAHCEKHLASPETETLLPAAQTLAPIRAMSHLQCTQRAAGHVRRDITSSSQTPIWLSSYKLDERRVVQFIRQTHRYHSTIPESVMRPLINLSWAGDASLTQPYITACSLPAVSDWKQATQHVARDAVTDGHSARDQTYDQNSAGAVGPHQNIFRSSSLRAAVCSIIRLRPDSTGHVFLICRFSWSLPNKQALSHLENELYKMIADLNYFVINCAFLPCSWMVL